MAKHTEVVAGTADPAAGALPTNRHARYRAITERLLEGVEAGADALVEAVRAGAIKGRDLAIVVGIMVDKLAVLEAKGDPDPASPAELEKRLATLRAAEEELRRRKAQQAPSAAPPVVH